MEACLIVTYRCNARCVMCDTWRNPSPVEGEFAPELLEKLPDGLSFVNITGGEPFLRSDLEDLVRMALHKTRRLVISTNGFFTDKICALAERFGDRIGVRVSIEGMKETNDNLRGLKDGFERGVRTLTKLRAMGLRDVGFGMTLSNENQQDLLPLYGLSKNMDMEFATAVMHNSFYFHKDDNVFTDPEGAAREFEKLAVLLLRSWRVKNWFRAYFNMGLADRVMGRGRPLPCRAGSEMFFLDPFGRVLACNGSEEPLVMGDLRQESFAGIWGGERAQEVRKQVRECRRQCWMIGSAAPAMRKRLGLVGKWVLRNKLGSLFHRRDKFSPSPIQDADK